MGLFDKAVKKGLGDALGGVLGNKVTEALEQATGLDLDNNGQQGRTASPFGSVEQQSPIPGRAEASSSYSQTTPATLSQQQVTGKAYFRAIINEVFSAYIIREDVPVSELGGEGRAYDFALFSNGECAGVVMLVEHNRDNNRAYKGARSAAETSGVPFINFYTHMPNERGFVINRIKRLARPAL